MESYLICRNEIEKCLEMGVILLGKLSGDRMVLQTIFRNVCVCVYCVYVEVCVCVCMYIYIFICVCFWKKNVLHLLVERKWGNFNHAILLNKFKIRIYSLFFIRLIYLKYFFLILGKCNKKTQVYRLFCCCCKLQVAAPLTLGN